ncbi:MAG: acyl-CoA thioesterase [bacterium]|nr:acyl-CoA thioesterase [bacterium]
MKTRRRVEFADTDMAGMVHFSRFVIFMETAEHEFREAAGFSVDTVVGRRRIGWPRVSVSCDFASPARFGEVLEIHVRLLRKGAKSLTFGFDIHVGTREVCSGKMTSVCCEITTDGQPQAIAIPGEIAERLDVAPE